MWPGLLPFRTQQGDARPFLCHLYFRRFCLVLTALLFACIVFFVFDDTLQHMCGSDGLTLRLYQLWSRQASLGARWFLQTYPAT